MEATPRANRFVGAELIGNSRQHLALRFLSLVAPLVTAAPKYEHEKLLKVIAKHDKAWLLSMASPAT